MRESQPPSEERSVGSGEADFERILARIERLRRAAVEGVVLPERVELRPNGDVVVIGEQAAPPLVEAIARRDGLSAGEAVWWGVRVARILASLHRAGIAHGAVSSVSVRCGQSGVQMLGVTSADDDASAPTAAADVSALGNVLDQSVCSADAARVSAWTQTMTADDHAARPSAAMVAHALTSCAPETPIRFGHGEIAARLRGRWSAVSGGAAASGGVAGGAAASGGAAAEPVRGKARGASAGPADVPAHLAKQRSDSRPLHAKAFGGARTWLGAAMDALARPRVGRRAGAVAVVLLAVVATVAVTQATGGGARDDAAAAGTLHAAWSTRSTASGAATAFMYARIGALGGGDPQGWLAGVLASSPAATEANTRIEQLAAGTLVIVADDAALSSDPSGGSVDDGSVAESGSPQAAPLGDLGHGLLLAPIAVREATITDDSARVMVEVSLAAHWVTSHGETTLYPAMTTVVEIVLVRDGGAWLVSEATEIE